MKKEFNIINTYIKTVSKDINDRRIKNELKDELFSHLIEIYERNTALGMSDEDAQKDAVAHMGDSEAVAKTFKKLYPISSFDFLQNNMSSFIHCLAWSLVVLLSRAEPLNSVLYISLLYVICEKLFLYRKVNKQFKIAHNTAIINVGFVITLNSIYNYFILDYSFYKFIILGSAVISCIEYFFIFYGIKELEKRLKTQKDASSSPIISCILLIVTQFLVSFAAVLTSGYVNIFLAISAFFTAIFPIVMLGGSTTELFDKIETYAPKSKKERRKQTLKSVVFLIVTTLLLIGIEFVTANRPVTTTDFIAEDTTVQISAEKIRENLISLGLPQNIANDLPDSEIAKYYGAEQIDFNLESSDYYKTDFNYKSYAFFFPENDLQPPRVRVLFVLDGFEVYKKLYRDGIYFWNDNDGVSSVTEYPSEEKDGSFCQILCEVDGETQRVLPFYQNNKIYPDDILKPIGCDFGFAKNGKNHRIYISQTFVPDESTITVGLEYYHTDHMYNSTVHSHYVDEFLDSYGFGGTAKESIRGHFKNPYYIEPENSEPTLLGALQALLENLPEDESLDLSELESVMEESLGQDIDSELLENIVNQITDEVSNP